MTTKRKLSLALLAVLLGVALTACGGGSPQVSSVSVTTPNGSEVTVGETLQLDANVEAEAGAATEVIWSSGDEAIATVDGDGLVTGNSAGSVTITATSKADASKSGSVSITVTPDGGGGGGGDPPGEDEVIVHENVRVLGEAGRNDLTKFDLDLQTGQGELRFKVGDPAVAALEPGLILVSEPVAGVAPHGFLQRIESKRQEGNEIIFETRQANLLEALGQAQINFEEELEPAEVVDSQTFYEGVTLSYATEGITPQASTGFDFNLTFDEVLIDVDGDTGTTDDQLRIDGIFRFDARASADIDICFCGEVDWAPDWAPLLQRFTAKARLEQSVDINVTGELVGRFDKRFEVARLNFGSFVVPVGPVPVVFVIDMVISVGANGQFEAHLEASALQRSVAQVGVEYTDSDGYRDLNEFDFDFDFPTPEITAAASARAFLRPQLNVEIYGLAGPYLYAEAFVEADAKLHRDPFWRFTAGIDVGLGFVVDLPILGKIVDYENKLVGFEETLQESTNEAPSLDIISPTDGVRLLDGETLTLRLQVSDREQESLTITLTDSSGQVLSTNGTFPDGRGFLFATDLCVGSYDFTATATDNQGETDSETISATVDNRTPTMSVNEEIYAAEPVYVGGLLFGLAEAYDITCETGEGEDANGADQSLIEWYLDGQRISSGGKLFYPLDPSDYNAGDTLTLQARYNDGREEVRSAEIVVTIEERPPGEEGAPRAVILAPSEGEIPRDDVTLRGLGSDPQEGRLSGDALVWEAERDGTFVEIARGEEATWDLYEFAGGCEQLGGLYKLRLRVTDSEGNADTMTIEVEVEDVIC